MSLFVGNISRQATENELVALFSKHGPCKIDLKTSFAFIEYAKEEDAKSALEAVHGIKIAGLYVNVEWSRKSAKFDAGRRQQHRRREDWYPSLFGSSRQRGESGGRPDDPRGFPDHRYPDEYSDFFRSFPPPMMGPPYKGHVDIPHPMLPPHRRMDDRFTWVPVPMNESSGPPPRAMLRHFEPVDYRPFGFHPNRGSHRFNDDPRMMIDDPSYAQRSCERRYRHPSPDPRHGTPDPLNKNVWGPRMQSDSMDRMPMRLCHDRPQGGTDRLVCRGREPLSRAPRACRDYRCEGCDQCLGRVAPCEYRCRYSGRSRTPNFSPRQRMRMEDSNEALQHFEGEAHPQYIRYYSQERQGGRHREDPRQLRDRFASQEPQVTRRREAWTDGRASETPMKLENPNQVNASVDSLKYDAAMHSNEGNAAEHRASVDRASVDEKHSPLVDSQQDRRSNSEFSAEKDHCVTHWPEERKEGDEARDEDQIDECTPEIKVIVKEDEVQEEVEESNSGCTNTTASPQSIS